MAILSTGSTCFQGLAEQRFQRVLRPIKADLQAVEACLDRRLQAPNDATVRDIVGFLRNSPGKRLRPALVLLSSRAVAETSIGHPTRAQNPVWIATAMELIHMASLVHDDFIDAAPVRHHRSSVNARWGGAVSIALGDYLCASALQLIAQCSDPPLFAQLGAGLSAMCEGEMLQVMGRGDFALSEQDCLAVVEKKTAALFAACCAAGAASTVEESATHEHFRRFGLHVGMAFQILDDCRDLLSDQTMLGKKPAQDLLAGDVTLPLLFFLEHAGRNQGDSARLSSNVVDAQFLNRVKAVFRTSDAGPKTEQLIRFHTDRAKQELRHFPSSEFRESLCLLADHIAESVSETLAR